MAKRRRRKSRTAKALERNRRNRLKHRSRVDRHPLGGGEGQFESLEPRLMLSAVDETAAGTYPASPYGFDNEVVTMDWNGQEVEAVEDEWIFKFDGGENSLVELGQELADWFDSATLKTLGGNFALLSGIDLAWDLVNDWVMAYNEVTYAEPNTVMSLMSSPDDTDYDSQWALNNSGQTFSGHEYDWVLGTNSSTDVTGIPDADIDAEEAYDAFFDGTPDSSNVVIGVADGGLYYAHPDLYLNIWINQGEIPSSIMSNLTDVDNDGLITFYDLNDSSNSAYVTEQADDGEYNDYIDAGDLLADEDWCQTTGNADDDGNGYINDIIGWDFANDDNNPYETFLEDRDHGTHVAGTISAISNNEKGVAGVSWNAQLMALQLFSRSSGGTSADLVAMNAYAAAMASTYGVNLAATNNSYGGGSYSQAVCESIKELGDANVLFVAAAGNSHSDLNDTPIYPAAYDLENVITVAATDAYDNLTPFSSYGSSVVELAAPGQDILSTYPGNTYALNTGTSMAAPHVTGVVALMAAYAPAATATEIKSALLAGVDKLPSLESTTVTGGRLNAYKALSNLNVTGPRVSSMSPRTGVDTTNEIIVNFTEDIDSTSIIPANIKLRDHGTDGVFDTADDTTYSFQATDFTTTGNTVKVNLGSNLATTRYRLTLVGDGSTPIQNTSGEALNNGQDHVVYFEILAAGTNECDDTVTDATDTGIDGSTTFSYTTSAYIGDSAAEYAGDGVFLPGDVDAYKLTVGTNQTIIADIDSSSGGLDSYLRLFYDNSGVITEVDWNEDWDGIDSAIQYDTGTNSGTYYVAVSGTGNDSYDPKTAGTQAWESSVGSYGLSITVASDTPSYSTAITGQVWHDVNGDGQQTNEETLSGWTVYIDANSNGQLDVGESSDVTDRDGEYWLVDPGAGTYTIGIVAPTGWTVIAPAGGTHSATVTTGAVTGKDFYVQIASGSRFTVTSDGDHAGMGEIDLDNLSLRQALALAALYSGSDTIAFDGSLSGSPIVFTKHTYMLIDSDVDIEGLGSDNTTIDANEHCRVFAVDDGFTTTISDLTVTGGAAPFTEKAGGGIYNNDGNLTLDGVVISGNSATSGGGVYNHYGALTIRDSVISDNVAAGHSSATPFGGAVYSYGGEVDIDGIICERNFAHKGGALAFHSSVHVDIVNGLFAGNTASSYGGGIYSYYSVIDLANATISGNTAGLSGGGILTHDSIRFNATNVTVTGNSVNGNDDKPSTAAGGIHASDSNKVTLHNSIVADNISGSASQPSDIAGSFVNTSSYNLIGVADNDTSGIINGTNGNQVGTAASPIDAMLAPLADNGGSTKTHALLPGSPAIDAGDDENIPAGVTTDQRGTGYSRTIDRSYDSGDTVDIGAFETSVFTVSTLTDESDTDYTDGDLSLREALSLAASNAGADIIGFLPSLSGTMTLDSQLGELVVGSDVDIIGSGASTISIDANSNSRVMKVNDGVTASVSGLTITGGSESSGYGGGILNLGTLTVADAVIDSNAAQMGAGIANGTDTDSGVLTVERTTFTNNTASYHGGAIMNEASGTLTVDTSTLSGNSAVWYSGGVCSFGGTAAFTNSTISGNSSFMGGGVFMNASATVTMVNSTVVRNSLTSGWGGGGIYNNNSGALTLHNSLIAENTSGTGGVNNDDVYGYASTSSSYNLIGADNVIGIDNGTNGNQVGTLANPIDPMIGDLADNGGATKTHALLLGSPAIDAGSDSQASGIDYDQRGEGFARIVDRTAAAGDSVDIGAYEVPAGFVVSTLTDESDLDYTDGDLSLREAIDLASSTPGIDVITFASNLNGSIVLSQTLGQLVIDTDVDIQGPGASTITIDADDNSRVFSVNSSVTASISGLTITGGYESTGFGGGIYNAGNLTLVQVVLDDNEAANGGAIASMQDAVLQIDQSTLSNNTGSLGGALFLTDDTALNNTTISGNTATSYGGGMYAFGGNVSVTNCTITNNLASGASAWGGGIDSFFSAVDVILHNTIVAGNFRNTGTTPDDIYGYINDYSSYNLIGVDTNLLGPDDSEWSNQIGTSVSPLDPGLGALADNGGPVPTHALLVGSLAIDAGSNSEASNNGVYGFDRVIDGTADDYGREIIDIGAYELALTTTASTTTWQNEDVAAQTGTFTFEFDIVASDTDTDIVWGLSDGQASGLSSLAAAIELDSSGNICVMDDGVMTDTLSDYAADTSYHFTVVVDITNATYDVYLDDGTTAIADDFDFQSSLGTVSELDNWAFAHMNGISSATVSNVVVA